MQRIPLIKLSVMAAIAGAALLSGCASLERDTLFENNGPRPALADDRAQPFGAPAAAMRPVAGYRHP
jgi:hypothetical protein